MTAAATKRERGGCKHRQAMQPHLQWFLNSESLLVLIKQIAARRKHQRRPVIVMKLGITSRTVAASVRVKGNVEHSRRAPAKSATGWINSSSTNKKPRSFFLRSEHIKQSISAFYFYRAVIRNAPGHENLPLRSRETREISPAPPYRFPNTSALISWLKSYLVVVMHENYSLMARLWKEAEMGCRAGMELLFTVSQ